MLVNYTEPSVRLKLVGLSHMVKNWLRAGLAPSEFQVRSFSRPLGKFQWKSNPPSNWRVFKEGHAEAVRDV